MNNFKIKGILNGLEYEQFIPPEKRNQWFKFENQLPLPMSCANEVILQLEFKDFEDGNDYTYLRATWGHNQYQKWFVHFVDNKNIGAQFWDWLPERYNKNIIAWKFL